MSLLKSFKGWIFAIIAGAVAAYAAKHPEIPQEVVFMLLGAIAHALGVETEKKAREEEEKAGNGPASRR
jgi:4-hydroxybenzoate polyprenyltransferase